VCALPGSMPRTTTTWVILRREADASCGSSRLGRLRTDVV
jgi:hypothetical protein